MAQLPFNEEYVRKLAAGDPAVQKHFTEHFGPLLRLKLRSKLRSPALIEDVRQETFLRVLASLHKPGNGGLRSPESLGAYVNSVCNFVICEILRRETRHPQIPEDHPEKVDESASPVESIESEERKRLVEGVLGELPARDRELLRQIYFEERDKSDICRDMNINTEYLRVLIYRARNRFRELLEKRRLS